MPDEKSRKSGLAPKAMLKADKETGNIQLDSETQLTGVPPEAWDLSTWQSLGAGMGS